MKRAEMILRIKDQLEYICSLQATDSYVNVSDELAEDFLAMLEEIGMQPPLSTATLVLDPTRKGTFMHTEAKREWDEE